MNKSNPFQRSMIFVLIGLYLTLLLNSLFLFALDFNQFFAAYRGALIFHIVLGLVIALPLIAFLVPHLKKMPHRSNLPAMMVGIFIAASILLTIGTGLLLYNEDFAAQKQPILWIHVASVFGTLLGLYGHLRLRRKETFHFYIKPSWANLKKVGLWKHSLLKTITLSGFIFLVFIVIGIPNQQTGQAISEEKFKPSFAEIEDNHYLHPSALDGSKSCGDQSCHPDIYEQWNESAHHFSSFNNPYYEKSIEVLQTGNSLDKVRWCASCHDPMLLLTGDMEDPEKDFFKHHPNAKKGITCLSCHAIQGTKDITGNGNFQIKDVGYAALGQTFFGESPELRKAIIQTKPEPHGASMLSPMMQTEKFCTSCHKVSIPQSVNNYRWKRGQNHYDDWYSSSFSGKHLRAFYDRETQSCISCHMTKVPSNDAGNEQGLVSNHRFAAANTALPYLNQHVNQLAQTIDFLQNDIAEIDIFSIKINGEAVEPNTDLPNFATGDKVELELIVRNKNVGHQLPSGTNDSNEWWLKVQLLNAQGKTILASGELDEQGKVDSTAHFFKAILIDKNGDLIDKRNVHDWYATVHNSAIPSGLSHIVRYKFTAPSSDIVEIKAALQQRKFNHFYNQFTFAGEPKALTDNKVDAIRTWVLNDTKLSEVPKIPITTVAETQRILKNKYTLPTLLWQRWNNYGIGLMQEENYQQAMKAFQKVSDLQPEKADGFLNQSRVFLAEGSLFKAEALLMKILERFPDDLKIQYFLGQAYFAQGRFDKALEYWEKVIHIYPEDVVLLSDLGQLYYLNNEYQKAEELLQRAFAINPESYTVIYRMMLLYAATGKEVTGFQNLSLLTLYEKYKPNEAEEVAIANFKKQHSVVNNESQVVHYHELK